MDFKIVDKLPFVESHAASTFKGGSFLCPGHLFKYYNCAALRQKSPVVLMKT